MDVVLDFTKVKSIVESYTEKVDSLIDSYADKKEQLISLLQDIQTEFNYLPGDVLIKISQKLDIPLSQVFSVATFFRAFSLEPKGRHLVSICTGTACHVRGGQKLVDKMERDYGIKPGETTEDMKLSLETVNCLGCCALGPVVVVDGKYESQMNADKLDRVLRRCE
ncbi:NAD(P)H-dependent oxidoreductase subunit E [Chloroflexota bacterium]